MTRAATSSLHRSTPDVGPESNAESIVGVWYAEHHARLYAVCLRVLADAREAEEATQDAFVEAWKSWASFRGDASVATWLHVIASRVALRRLHQTRRHEQRHVRDDRAAEAIPIRPAMHAERMDLEVAIAGLPPRARAVLVLHEIHGYQLAEIADWMGTSLGTTKSQLHRARQLLKETLDR